MKRFYGLKILLAVQIVSLLITCNFVEAAAGGDYPENKMGYNETDWIDYNLWKDDFASGKVMAYIYSNAVSERGNALLDATFTSSYFGLNITKVEDLTSSAYLYPVYPEEKGILLALTLAENESVSDAIEVLKDNPIVEYTQVDTLIDFRNDFKPGKLFVKLNSDVVPNFGSSLSDVNFVSSFFGVDIVAVNVSANINVLYLTLAEENKQSVLDAIVILNGNANVMYATPLGTALE